MSAIKVKTTLDMKKLVFIISFIAVSFALQSQTPTPGAEQEKSILYINATVHIGDGTRILEGSVGFDKGIITYVGSTKSAQKKLFDSIIDASGQQIYPGFIAPNSTLGLQEIGAVRATRDQREVGEMNPHVRSIVAYQTESEITPTVRTNGVLLGQITPRGRFVAGTSSVVHFDAWNWDDAIISKDDGMHIYWPRMYERDYTRKAITAKERESYSARIEALTENLDKAKAAINGKDSVVLDVRLEAFGKLLRNELTLFVHAQTAKQITAAIKLKRDYDIKNMHIIGGREAHLVTNLLKENEVGVMIGRVHDLPWNNYDDVDLPYKLPKLLEDAGVLWCFENAGDMEQMNSRNLPFYAGTAVAYGLTEEQAIKGLTLNTAKILGIELSVGTLEVGKRAVLFVSKGDALDMITNNVLAAYIDGRALSLWNRQIQLYEKYKAKYEN